MVTYEASWTGFDGGREGLWKADKLLGVLAIVARHAGEGVYDRNAAVYAELEQSYPDDAWRSEEAGGRFRPLFRDYAHPWTRTGLLDLESGEFQVTPLGQRLLDGRISLRQVYMRVMASFRDDEESPFRIVASALLRLRAPISTEMLVRGVKGEYRPGADDLDAALARADRSRVLTSTESRRMHQMMLFMSDAGLVVESPKDQWVATDTDGLRDLASDDVPIALGAPSSLGELADSTLLPENLLEGAIASLSSTRPQVIFAGPPGTGKTFVAKALAAYLTRGDASRVRVVQFHPNYGYEDFVEGLRPDETAPTLRFVPFPGVLLRLVRDMVGDVDDPSRPYVLIIDEMNRANLPRVFGELMYLLEYRAQGDEVELQYSGTRFRLPTNLLIVGTMNTADRSIRSIDTALRRRFDIFELPPSEQALDSYYSSGLATNSVPGLSAGLRKLNDRIEELRGDRHHKIGHTFLMRDDFTASELARVWDLKIMPLIEEYFFDRPEDAKGFSMQEFWGL